MYVSKNDNNKKYSNKLLFSNVNNFQKDSDDSRNRKLALKIGFWYFLKKDQSFSLLKKYILLSALIFDQKSN